MSKMIEMKIQGILDSPLGMHVFLGEETEEICETKMLSMVVDRITGGSIRATLCNQGTPRPLTHELMKKAFEALGAKVDRIEITRIEENAFIGSLVIIDKLDMETHLDSRPSDGIAVALRFGAKILVAKEVLDKSGKFIPEELKKLLAESMQNL